MNRMNRGGFALLGLCPLLVAGCLGPAVDAGDSVVFRVENTGSVDLSTDLVVRDGDDLEVHRDSFAAPGEKTVTRGAALPREGAFSVVARWSWSNETRSYEATSEAAFAWADCPSVDRVIITFKVEGSTGIAVSPEESNCPPPGA